MPKTLKTGQVIDDRYEIIKLIGEGGMSYVYQAKELESKKNVAIKFLKHDITSSYAEDNIRFQREIKVISKLNHPDIVKIYSSGSYDNTPYIVMELIKGESLHDYLARGKSISINDSIKIIKSLSDVLNYVHSQNLLHRDIKPGNIMFVKIGNKISVKLLDFGIALVMELKNITDEKEVAGTFGYMSPEATGILKKPIDERSDLYSLGVVFYKLLTTKSPFKSTKLRALLHEQVTSNLVPPSRYTEAIPHVISDIIMKLLEKEQDYRYQSAKGLSYDLEKTLNGEMNFFIGQKDQKVKIAYQTRLVGRDDEFNTLKMCFTKAESGNGNACFIAGEAGMGKSRLADELKEHIYSQGYEHGGIFLQGRCINQENKAPYQPFRDALDLYILKISNLDEKSRKKEIARIKEILGNLGQIIVELNRNIETLIGKQPELVKLDGERENQRFMMVASKFFSSIAGNNRILTIYLDDLQWADEGSLILLKEIIEKISNSNLLIVGTYRVEEVSNEHSLAKMINELEEKKDLITKIGIKAFDQSRINKLVAGVLGELEDKAVKLSKYVLEKSEGNPFFAITILRDLVEEKTIIWNPKGYWEEDWKKIEKLNITNNIVDLILKRIKNLTESQSALLCAGAIIGREFEIRLLFDLIDDSEEHIIGTIDELIDMHLIEKSLEKGKVVFIHDRIREAFLLKIKNKDKKLLHLKIAESIESLNHDNIDLAVFDLAYHFSEAGNEDKSLKYSMPAGKKAKNGYANEEAIKYYTTAIKILEKKSMIKSKEWIDAKESLSEIYLTIGLNNEAIENCNEIMPFKESNIEKAKIYRKVGNAFFKMGNWDACEETIYKGLYLLGEKPPKTDAGLIFSILKELIVHLLYSFSRKKIALKEKKNASEKSKEIVWCYRVLTWVYALNNINKFIRSTLRLLNIAESKIEKSKELAAALSVYAALCMAVPIFKISLKNHKLSLFLCDELNDKWATCQGIQLMGFCYSWMGDIDNCIDSFKKSIKASEDIGDIWELGMCYQGLGDGYRYKADLTNNIDTYQKYWDVSKKINDEYGVCASTSWLSFGNIMKGDYKKAEEIVKYSISMCKKTRSWFIYCHANCHYGHIHLENKNYIEAIEYFEKSKKIYEENSLLKNYTVFLYSYLADGYIEKFKNTPSKNPKKDKRTIYKACKKALNETKLWPNNYGQALRIMGKYYALVNKNSKAKKYFIKSITQIKKIGIVYEEAKTYYEYSIFLKSTKKDEKSKEELSKAYKIFKRIGSKVYIKRCEELLGIKTEVEMEDEISPQERLRLERRMNTALDTGRYLSSILILDDLLEKIMDKTIELVGAERGLLFLYPDSEKSTKLNAEAKVLRNIKREGIDVSSIKEGILPIVEENRKPLISADASIDQSISEHSMSSSNFAKNLKSLLCAPIITKGNLLGMIYLDNHHVTELFSDEDLNVLNLIASQAGVSIENARLYQNLQEQERLKKEMEIAERIQTAIVPEPPEHKELEISAIMQPAEEVGGDYYDIIYDNQDNLWFAIGDVSGHGVTPGLIMMMAQSSFSSYIRGDEAITPKDAIVKVNNILTENIRVRLKEAHFMTMYFIKYLGKGKFTCSNAGHPDIILYRSKSKSCELIKLDSLYLGIKPDISTIAQDIDFKLSSGDIMILYTDGVIESRHKDDKKCMGSDILQDIIIENASKSLDDLKAVVLERTLDWCGNRPADDITMVFVKMK